MTAFTFVRNLDRQVGRPAQVISCRSFASRLRGMICRRGLPAGAGVLLVDKDETQWNSAIHMFFLPFDLAVFWINSNMEVVDKVLARARHAAYLPRRPARYVLELPADMLGSYEIGDRVQIFDA